MTVFSPKNPDFENAVKTSFAKQGAMTHLGAKLVKVAPGFCEIEMPYAEELCQQHGFIHAGIVSAVADSAGGYAGFSLMPEGDGVLTIEFKVNLMAPAAGEKLIARGQVIRAGKTITVAQSDAYMLQDGKEKHVATMQLTLMCVTGNPTVSG